jgi:hypothetical protein
LSKLNSELVGLQARNFGRFLLDVVQAGVYQRPAAGIGQVRAITLAKACGTYTVAGSQVNIPILLTSHINISFALSLKYNSCNGTNWGSLFSLVAISVPTTA